MSKTEIPEKFSYENRISWTEINSISKISMDDIDIDCYLYHARGSPATLCRAYNREEAYEFITKFVEKLPVSDKRSIAFAKHLNELKTIKENDIQIEERTNILVDSVTTLLKKQPLQYKSGERFIQEISKKYGQNDNISINMASMLIMEQCNKEGKKYDEKIIRKNNIYAIIDDNVVEKYRDRVKQSTFILEYIENTKISNKYSIGSISSFKKCSESIVSFVEKQSREDALDELLAKN